MWDFPRFTCREWALKFSWGALVTMGARSRAGAGAGVGMGVGMEAGARASKTALKIPCKSSSEYLGILVAARALGTRGFGPEGPAG